MWWNWRHTTTFTSTATMQGGDLHESGSADLVKNYCQHSPHFNTSPLDAANIKRIFRKEVRSIASPGVWMGIWQIHAVASILGSRLSSIYPKLSALNPTVVEEPKKSVHVELHRTLLPRVPSVTPEPAPLPTIMWTRMGDRDSCSMTNHFVACLPLSPRESAGTHPSADTSMPKVQLRWPAQPPPRRSGSQTNKKKGSLPSPSPGLDIRSFLKKKT